MPPPERQVEAYYVGVVMLASVEDPGSWTLDARARVFTLEMTRPGLTGTRPLGVVCEWTGDMEHLNYGIGVLPEKGAFLQAMHQLLEAPATPVIARHKA